jgi:hypothetical protein
LLWARYEQAQPLSAFVGTVRGYAGDTTHRVQD